MNKILCPTDFSDVAHGAIAYAAKLAQETNSELTLLNVHSIFGSTPVQLLKGHHKELAEIGERLEAQSREVSKTFKISCYAEVQSTYRKLSTVLQERGKGFDLIVMGSNGPDDTYQFFAGSNTYNAIIKSHTPLLLIPAGYLYNEIKTMVYAFDYLRERDLHLARLAPWVKMLNCELTVLQVMEEAYSEEANEDLNELQFIIGSAYGNDLRWKYNTIRSSEVAQSIDTYILQNQPDALALCSVQRNLVERIFHKSTIKHISAVSRYPVFVFHE